MLTINWYRAWPLAANIADFNLQTNPPRGHFHITACESCPLSHLKSKITLSSNNVQLTTLHSRIPICLIASKSIITITFQVFHHLNNFKNTRTTPRATNNCSFNNPLNHNYMFHIILVATHLHLMRDMPLLSCSLMTIL